MSKNVQKNPNIPNKVNHRSNKQFLHNIYASVKVLSQNSTAHAFGLIIIFLTVFMTHFSGGIKAPIDSKWTIHTAMSIIKEGNTSLDEYKNLIEAHNYFAIKQIDDHLYTRYPIGTSLISVPVVFILDKFLARGLSIDLESSISREIPAGIETFIASIIIALASLFIYLISRLALDVKYSILCVFVFAFCTSAWSTGSRSLWQHGPSMCLLTISLYLLLLAKHKPKHEGWILRIVSLPLAFSYVVRPTNSIPILIVTLFIFIRYRKHFLPYCLWSMIVAIPFLVYNLLLYHSMLSPYYLPKSQLRGTPYFFEALAGTLFSPARGLFIFSPVFLFAIYGVILKIKHKRITILDYSLLLMIFLHWVIISSFPVWWGGHCFGPRYFSDIIPFFLYFLIPVFQEISKSRSRKNICILVFLLCIIAISFFIHYEGVTSLGPFVWNFDPVDVNHEPSRLWDWHDIPFLRPDYVFVPY